MKDSTVNMHFLQQNFAILNKTKKVN